MKETAKAEITTVPVTLKMIRVGTRNLSKSMFAQLPYEELTDDEGLVRPGTSWWGLVRNAGKDMPLNAVTERDGVLYRSPVEVSEIKYLAETIAWVEDAERTTAENRRPQNYIERSWYVDRTCRDIKDKSLWLAVALRKLAIHEAAEELEQLFIAG